MQAGTHPDEGGIRSGSGDPARVRDSAVTLHTQGSLPDARSTTNCCHRMKRRCQPGSSQSEAALRGRRAALRGSRAALRRAALRCRHGSPARPSRQLCAPRRAACPAALRTCKAAGRQRCVGGTAALRGFRAALQAALRTPHSERNVGSPKLAFPVGVLPRIFL